MNKLNQLAGSLFLAMILLHFMQLAGDAFPVWISGLCAWLLLMVLILSVPIKQFIQCFALSSIGVALILWSIARGQTFSLPQLLEQNNNLLVMLSSVGFLKLIAAPATSKDPLPEGRKAFLQTLFGTHLLGAVINLTILILVADRLNNQQALGRKAVIALNRSFTSAVFWSPFFAGMGVALTYAPGASLSNMMGYGILLTLFGLGFTVFQVGGLRLDKLDQFRGYPTHASSLLIPLVLAVAILCLHYQWPDITILMLVSITSVTLTVLLLLIRRGKAINTLWQHSCMSPLRMSREFGLFLGIAVLTVGLQNMIASFDDLRLFEQFGAAEASLTLLTAIIIGLLAVHPLVTIAITSMLLIPLNPDSDILALLFVAMWGIGTMYSPFSGVNITLRGQFGISGKDIMRWNAVYVIVMWLAASALFTTMFALNN